MCIIRAESLWSVFELLLFRIVMNSNVLSLLRSFTHFLTGVCAIIGGIFTGVCSPVAWWAMIWMPRDAAAAAALMCFLSCSGWSDWFAHLPLSQSHPEEDRAGQGFLTEPPGAGRPMGDQRPERGHTEKGRLSALRLRQVLIRVLIPLLVCWLQTLERNFWTLLRFLYFTEHTLPKGMNLNQTFLKLLQRRQPPLETAQTLPLRSWRHQAGGRPPGGFLKEFLKEYGLVIASHYAITWQ